MPTASASGASEESSTMHNLPTHVIVSLGRVTGFGVAAHAGAKKFSEELQALQGLALELAGGPGPKYREQSPEAAAASALLDALEEVDQAVDELSGAIEKIESLTIEPKLVSLARTIRAL